MAQEENTDGFGGSHARRLPLELAELLAPEVEHALNHPLRRQILRTLGQSEKPRSAAEIVATGLPQAALAQVSYHAMVLESCDVIRVSEVVQDGGRSARRYTSNVVNDLQVVTVLGATEPLDHLGG